MSGDVGQNGSANFGSRSWGQVVKKFFLASLCSRSSGRHGGVRGQVDRREEEPDMDMTEHANVDFVPRSP